MNNDDRPDAENGSGSGQKKPYSAPELTEYGNLDDITGAFAFTPDASAAIRARVTIIVSPTE